MTVTFTEAEFTRGGPQTSNRLPRHQTFLAEKLARPQGEGYEFGAYRIHRALHAKNPGTRARMALEHGEHLIAALFEGETVGFCRQDFMWVHTDHRGNGLGPEMATELLVAKGCESWDKADWIRWLDTPSFTPDGFRNRPKTFRKLVERGILQEP